MQIAGIYKITSPSGKIYIGQSTNLKNRLKQYKRLKCKNQTLIYNSLKKYGVDLHTFDVIVQGNFNSVLLDELEKHYIRIYNSFRDHNSKGLNLTIGGGNKKIMSKESKSKQASSRKKRRNLGKLHNSRLLYKDVVEIKKLIAYNYEKRTIGKMFAVAETTIAEIASNRNWKDVPDYNITEKDKKFILPERKQLNKLEVKQIKWLLKHSKLSYENIGTLYNVGAKTIHYYNSNSRSKNYPIIHKTYETRFLTQEQIETIKRLLEFSRDVETIEKIFNINTKFININDDISLSNSKINIPSSLEETEILKNIVNYSLISINQLSKHFNNYPHHFKKFKV